LRPAWTFFRNTPPPGTRTPVPANPLSGPHQGLTAVSRQRIIAYNLGRAELCQRAAKPEKVPTAITSSPARRSPMPRWVEARPESGRHLPHHHLHEFPRRRRWPERTQGTGREVAGPAGRLQPGIGAHAAQRKEEEFKKTNPQLALWMGIKAQLADTNGEKYFDEQLKGSGVPKLKGVVIDASRVPLQRAAGGYPEPDQRGLRSGDHPEAGQRRKAGCPDRKARHGVTVEIQWEGVPSAFTKEPFMLTMDTEKAKIEGLKLTPCVAAPVKKRLRRRAHRRRARTSCGAPARAWLSGRGVLVFARTRLNTKRSTGLREEPAPFRSWK